MGPFDPRFAHLMGRGGLPMAPQMGGVPRFRQPQMQQPIMPYQQGAIPQVTQTIAEFLQGYQQNQEQEKQKNLQEAQRDIELMKIGFPIDYKKTVQKMKKGGVELDLESPAPQVQQAAQPGPGFSVDAGPMGQQQMPAYQPTQQQMQAAQPMPQQSLWDRIKQGVGLSDPRVNPNSAPVLALQQMGQQFQEDAALQRGATRAGLQAQMDKDVLFHGIARGEPTAMDLGKKLGIVQKEPFEDVFNLVQREMPQLTRGEVATQLIATQLGMDKYKQQAIQLAEKVQDRFPDFATALQYSKEVMATGQSSIKPQASFEEKMKLVEQANKYQDIYPTLPRNIAMTMAVNDVSGNKQTSQAIQKVLSTKDDKTGWMMFPTQGQLDSYYKSANLTMEQKRYNLATQQFQQSVEAQQQAQQRHFESGMLNLFSQLRSQGNQEFDNAFRLYNAAEDSAAKRSAAQLMEDAMNKMPPMKLNITGPGGQKFNYDFNPSKVTADEVTKWFGDPEEFYLRGLAAKQAQGQGAPKTQSEFDKFVEKLMQERPNTPIYGPMDMPMPLPSSMTPSTSQRGY